MPLVNQFEITLKDFLPDGSDEIVITDRQRGTSTTVSNRLYAKLRSYADDNRLPFDQVVQQMREEILRTSAREPSAATTIDAGEKLAYFTGVLKQLDTLYVHAPGHSVLDDVLYEASEAIGCLVGYFLADSRK